MPGPSFGGRLVLTFESRRAKEIAALIANLDGRPLVAPALREVPLESNTEAVSFAAALIRGEFDAVIFLTAVGARVLVQAAGRACPVDDVLEALRRTKVVARGPKPIAVLRDWHVPVWAAAPEPNTWREVMSTIDARGAELPLAGARVAVQEYGVSNVELLDALRERGARVTTVPVYQWALPEDLTPLVRAIDAITRQDVDVTLVTSAIQLTHLWQVARQHGREPEVQRGLAHSLMASIGPLASAEIRRRGLQVDVEASHPKMGMLVREAAEHGDAARQKADST